MKPALPRLPMVAARHPVARAVLAAWLIVAALNEAAAHASERGHVLLLPTGYYLIGGALSVVASFLVLSVLGNNALPRYRTARWPIPAVPESVRMWTGTLSFAALVVLLFAGFIGSRDPLDNPLPMTIWTLLWVGVTLIQGTLGNLWRWIDPWHTPVCFARKVVPWRTFKLPPWLGCWPAIAFFVGFAWFELIDLAPEDPARLGVVVTAYWLFTFFLMVLFGHDEWGRRGEFLTLFFSILSRFAVFGADPDGRTGLAWPGARIALAPSLPLSGVVFLLCVLASVSFDGFSKTFLWLGAIGVNPLEFPGRSAVIGANTAGLLVAMAGLTIVFIAAVWLGERLVGSHHWRRAAGTLVWSIVPIALAYHFAHYLTVFLVDGQYALVALSDPFALGWNLFGMAGLHVEAGIVLGHEAAWWIWNAQALAIVAGHVLAVVLAHLLAQRLHTDSAAAMRSQLPLAALMVFYTVFGLWLLSTPSAG